jgi:hypothetical protein
MSKRDNEDLKLESILKSFVKENKLQKGLDGVNIEGAWRNLLGPGVNNYTTNIKLQNKTLHVQLSSSVLREELSYGKSKIITMLNKHLGKEVIEKLILR